jgi:hemoglobin/transferrin/lactoferrin receptor protein
MKSVRFRLFLAVCGFCLVASPEIPPVLATESEPVEEIIVVANKFGRPVRDVAANVTILTRAVLDANLATSVADMFRYTPGIDYEAAGNRFGSQGVTIRGIGGNRVAMLVDGVPLSHQFDVGSFSNATRDFLNAGLIERMEVLHGPASALYGSAAIGGVVAVRTPDPGDVAGHNSIGGNMQLIWRGADDSSHGTGMLAMNHGDKGLLLGGSLRQGDETESNATDETLDFRQFERRSALAKFLFDDARGGTWRFGLLHQDADVNSNQGALLGTGRYQSTTALLGEDDYQMQLLNAAWEFGSPGSLVNDGVLRVYYQDTSIAQKTFDERALAARPVAIDRYFQFDQDVYGVELNLQRSFATARAEHHIGAGLEFRERVTEEYRDGTELGLLDGKSSNVILGEEFPLRDFPRSKSREWGAYIEDSIDVGAWSLIAALRADYYTMAPLDDPMYAEDYPFSTPISLSKSDISPKLALLYHFNRDAELYLQYAEGFRAPPYEHANVGLEIPAFNYRAVPNPDLQSERSKAVELGMRWRGASWDFHAALFRTNYDDFIESRVRLGADPISGRILFQARNLDQATITGVEAGWQWQLTGVLENLAIDGSLYGARGENSVTGQSLESVGPAQAVIGIAWHAASGRRSLRLQASYADAWDDRNESAGELHKPGAYTLLDLYFAQRIGKRVTLRVAIMNLTDTTYWHWNSVRGLSPDDVLIPHLAQPGRNVSMSFAMDW